MTLGRPQLTQNMLFTPKHAKINTKHVVIYSLLLLFQESYLKVLRGLLKLYIIQSDTWEDF